MIYIEKNPNGDTRTAPKGVTFEEFEEANDMHIHDVGNVMDEIARMVVKSGDIHDCTKKSQERMFYKDFVNTLENDFVFRSGQWYQLHINAERHHLTDNCPEDVNLIDVIEMLVDYVCAMKARPTDEHPYNGHTVIVDGDILARAVANTQDLIDSMIEVKKDYRKEGSDFSSELVLKGE